MNGNDGFFVRMCNEAQNELASGTKSWKDAETNTLILACFGMLANHMTTRVVKPLWTFALSIAAGVIVFILTRLF